jgi:hypothetical protein
MQYMHKLRAPIDNASRAPNMGWGWQRVARLARRPFPTGRKPGEFAAIDAGLHSLRTEPILSAEQVSQNIRSWVLG